MTVIFAIPAVLEIATEEGWPQPLPGAGRADMVMKSRA
jgi:hypothetical protein